MQKCRLVITEPILNEWEELTTTSGSDDIVFIEELYKESQPCEDTLAKDALDYINRLKAENAEARKLCRKKILNLKANEFIRMITLAGFEVTAQTENEIVEKIRKDTAKEILQYLYEKMGNVVLSDTEIVKSLAIKYGVEVVE